jgi:hypothetical protein
MELPEPPQNAHSKRRPILQAPAIDVDAAEMSVLAQNKSDAVAALRAPAK